LRSLQEHSSHTPIPCPERCVGSKNAGLAVGHLERSAAGPAQEIGNAVVGHEQVVAGEDDGSSPRNSGSPALVPSTELAYPPSQWRRERCFPIAWRDLLSGATRLAYRRYVALHTMGMPVNNPSAKSTATN